MKVDEVRQLKRYLVSRYFNLRCRLASGLRSEFPHLAFEVLPRSGGPDRTSFHVTAYVTTDSLGLSRFLTFYGGYYQVPAPIVDTSARFRIPR